MTYYEILEVNMGDTIAVIKKSYKRLSKKYHPDSTIEPNENKFKKLVEAFEVLSNSEARKQYDSVLRSQKEKVSSTGFKMAPKGNFNTNSAGAIQISCTIDDITSKSRTFQLNGMFFSFPGYFTPSINYQHPKYFNVTLEVYFNIINQGVSRDSKFRFIKNLDGICITIHINEITYNGKSTIDIELPGIAGGITKGVPVDIVNEKEKTLICYNLGYPFEQPITGKIMKSLLIIPYK